MIKVQGLVATVLIIATGFVGCTTSTGYAPGWSDQVTTSLEEWDEAKLPQAMEDLERALESKVAPEPYLLFWLAMKHKKLGDLTKAEEWLTKAVELDPLYARAWFTRGVLRLWDLPGGNRVAALGDIEKAVALSPSTIDYGLTLINELRYQEGTRVRVDGLFQDLLRLQPQSLKVLSNRATWLRDNDRGEDAKKAALEAFEKRLGSENYYERAELAGVLISLGLREEGLIAMDEVLTSGTRDSWVFWGLGGTLFDMGLFPEAIRVLVQAESIEGSIPTDMAFKLGMARLCVSQAPTGTELSKVRSELGAYVAKGEGRVERAAAQFALTALVEKVPSVASFDELARVVEAEWGHPLGEKRKYHPWLEALLTKTGR